MLQVNIDPRHLRSLFHIGQSNEGKSLDEFLQRELGAIFEKLTDSQQTVALHQLQGRAQAIRDLRQAIATAGADLTKSGASAL